MRVQKRIKPPETNNAKCNTSGSRETKRTNNSDKFEEEKTGTSNLIIIIVKPHLIRRHVEDE